MAENIAKYYVYAHVKRNTNEVFYIGKGCRNRINSKSGRNKWWHNTVNKYGYDYFKIEDNINSKDAISLEEYWIGQFKSWGFKLTNICEYGSGMSGLKHNMDMYNKLIRPKITGRVQSSYERKMRSDILKNIHKNNKGIANRIATTHILNNKNGIKINQYSLDFNLISEHKSTAHASRVLGIKRTAINNNLKGHTKTCGGFIFKYSE